MKKIICSACLLGCECRYKGDSCRNEELIALAAENVLIPVCPEQLGGLKTPRDPSEIRGDKVVSSAGADVTAQYRKGAETALYIAQLNGADVAVLKAKSPSCGKGLIYDGTFTGGKVSGNGVTAELFLRSGIAVYTEDEIGNLIKSL